MTQGAGYCAMVHVPPAFTARRRKRAQILGRALALKDGYLIGLKKIAAACGIDVENLRDAFAADPVVSGLMEIRGKRRYRIQKSRLLDLMMVVDARRLAAPSRGAQRKPRDAAGRFSAF